MLVFVGVFLAIFIGMMLFTISMTQNLSKKVKEENLSLSPTPVSSSLYNDLPAQFPKDVPLISKAKVTGGKAENGQVSGVLTTSLTTDEVHDFYTSQLPTSGWHVTNESQAAGLVIIYFAKDKREGVVAIGRSDLGTSVSFSFPTQ